MSDRRIVLAALVAALAAAPVLALGQGQPGAPRQQPRPQGQQAQQQAQSQQVLHQQMMTRMQETVQRMTQLQQRAQQLAQGAQLQVRDRAQVTEQQRLMLRTCEALDQQAQQMKMVAERSQEMIRSRDFQRDKDMQRDMDRLRERLNKMADELDGSLQLMERVRQRTQTQVPPQTPE